MHGDDSSDAIASIIPKDRDESGQDNFSVGWDNDGLGVGDNVNMEILPNWDKKSSQVYLLLIISYNNFSYISRGKDGY